MAAWKASLIVLLAFCTFGVIPLWIVAQVADGLDFMLPPKIGFSSAAPTPTDAPDLALPRDAWVTRSVEVVPRPAQGAAIAKLDPAFPVRLLEHQRVGNTVWSRITWNGPVAKSGGGGWIPDTALISYGRTGAIQGDLGALAPSLRQAVSPYAKQLSAMVYIPSQNRTYIAGAPDSAFALGTGFRPMLLGALYGGAEASNKPVVLTDALSVSHGDATATPTIYQRLGGATGVSHYLTSHNIQGFQTASLWTACHASPRATIAFYKQLSSNLLQSKDRASVLSVLSLADAPTTANLVASWARSAGNLLVVGVAPTGNTFTMSIAGIFNPPKGPQVIVMAVVTAQPSTSAALQAMKAFYTQLTTLVGG
ncbi:MAG TPA: hypothetical protein VFU63_14900 [Ktedonobacterales bacterium]|nr:hypothetical protein [Ktedonobacterales bacterium]